MQDRKSEAAKKAWETRRSARYRAGKTERASKIALNQWCRSNGWKVVFFEGESGAPRTGIVDALMVRIKPGDADAIEIKLVQLKAGAGGLTAMEITRLKRATERVSKAWLLAACDGEELHFLPEIPGKHAKTAGT
ncbi:MAG: hypothetical protein A3F90_05590 [Deltaproteobacteria bacterium RIFCSPLOWO2_12_FULL_60_19]|nr:MAG: hypothetical protein A3F90_05590 [Deltaproteobacteria bacterium RIFCSPLOWO2_12_FULL_60_19]